MQHNHPWETSRRLTRLTTANARNFRLGTFTVPSSRTTKSLDSIYEATAKHRLTVHAGAAATAQFQHDYDHVIDRSWCWRRTIDLLCPPSSRHNLRVQCLAGASESGCRHGRGEVCPRQIPAGCLFSYFGIGHVGLLVALWNDDSRFMDAIEQSG